MDAVYTIGRDLVPKVKSMYRLGCEPAFLPTPVAVPERVEKAERPTVCYMARLDRRKRPRLFLDLARTIPQVRFIIAGKSRDPGWEEALRRDYAGLPNVEFAGFVDQFSDPRHGAILGESWVMVNTATREALPNAFIEAMAHGCAILSGVNPDGLAERFGYHVRGDDFSGGLKWLLAEDRWRLQGQAGAAYIRETFELNRAMDQHLRAYEAALAQPPATKDRDRY
jgi:glycosyltransferase involved in cell wall biosynthesis